MCGRYATFGPVSLSREAREVLAELEVDLISEINQREDQFNIAPTQRAPLILRTDDGCHFDMVRWGLIPSWSKDAKIGAKTINARADTVEVKPAFRAAFKKRRCLVPASGYYEWTGQPGSKQPYFIHDPEGELVMFAGLWETWRSAENEAPLRTFTVITGEPGKVSRDIHDRQPVILPPDLWEVWLGGTPDEAAATLKVVPHADLVYHPVAKAVGSPRANSPALIEPIILE